MNFDGARDLDEVAGALDQAQLARYTPAATASAPAIVVGSSSPSTRTTVGTWMSPSRPSTLGGGDAPGGPSQAW